MTLKAMIEKYKKISECGYESVDIGMVLTDLYTIKQENLLKSGRGRQG